MLDTQTVETPVNAPLTTHQRLVEAFTPVETTQIDNSEPAQDTAPEVQDPVQEPIAEPAKEPETTPEKDDGPKADESDEPEPADTEEEIADFNALDENKKYPTSDELKEEHPRAPKALIAVAAQLSAEARAGNDLKVKLGGEPFIEPIVKIAQGLQADEIDLTAVLNGVLEAKGQDALIALAAQSVYMAFANPDDQSDFGKGMKAIADAAIQERFGEGITPARIAKLAEWETYGWFEKLDKWTQDGFVDEDELAELIEINSNPRLKKILAENAELKRKVETTAPKGAERKEPDFAVTLNDTAGTKISDVLSSVVWAKSPLREISSDKDEIKQDKADFRKSLEEEAMGHFNRNPARKTLIEGLRREQQGTAAWQSQLVKAINAAVVATQPSTEKAEARLAKMYANTRNGNLAPKAAAPVEKQAPTVTTPAPVKSEVRSIKEIRANLAAAYERQAAGVR